MEPASVMEASPGSGNAVTETAGSTSRTLDVFDGSKPLSVRDYQEELLHRAIHENIIAYLETGTGKTLIAALLVKHYAGIAESRGQQAHQIVCCVVPTVLLVAQQATVFRRFVNTQVGEYTGDKGVDHWSRDMWRNEVKNHGVLVMTPQILVDCLSFSFITFNDIHLLILDEAHHCRKREPYARIMEFYKKRPRELRPRVFGMTASPINVSLPENEGSALKKIRDSVRELEANMCAKVVTIADLAGVRETVPLPAEEVRYYLPPSLARTNATEAALKTFWWSALRLQKTKEYAHLEHKRRELLRYHQDVYLEAYDPRAVSSRAERVADWFSSCLAHILHTQGPYCAALLAAVYLQNASGNGMLSDLGSIGHRQDQMYDVTRGGRGGRGRHHRHNGAGPRHNGSDGARLGRNAPRYQYIESHARRVAVSAEQKRVEDGIRALQAELATHAMSLDDVCNPDRALRECIFSVLEWLMRMLVWDDVLCQKLVGELHRRLLPATGGRDTSTRALAALIEAAVAVVPTSVVERALIDGPDCPEHEAWRQRMRCSLVTHKLHTLMAELYKHRAPAAAAMRDAAEREARDAASADTPSPAAPCADDAAQGPDGADEEGSRKWAGLVFATRQACVVVLHNLTKRLPEFRAFLNTAPLKRANSTYATFRQDAVLRDFRTGKYNLLFTTSVAEEGVDVQHCSLVVCYDSPSRPLSMVQTVGRARAADSRVVFMIEKESDTATGTDRVAIMERYMEQTRELVLVRDALDRDLEEPFESDDDAQIFAIPGTASLVSARECTSFLHRYCQSLATWRLHVQAAPRAERGGVAVSDTARVDVSHLRLRSITRDLRDSVQQEPRFEVTLFIPRGSPVREVTGHPASSKRMAYQSAAGEAVKALVSAGALDSHLRPTLDKRLKVLEELRLGDDFGLTTRLISGQIRPDVLPPSWHIQTWFFPGSGFAGRRSGKREDIHVLFGPPLSLFPSVPSYVPGTIPRPLSAPPETHWLCVFTLSTGRRAPEQQRAPHSGRASPCAVMQGCITHAMAPDGSRYLSIGMIVKRPLPALPPFHLYLDGADSDGGNATQCQLSSAGPINVSDANLMSSQIFHSAMLRIIFRAEAADSLEEAPLVALTLTVTDKDDHVRAALRVKRVVHKLGSGCVDAVMGAVAPDRAALKAPRIIPTAASASARLTSQCPVPTEMWSLSSAGAWYVFVPLTQRAPPAPPSRSGLVSGDSPKQPRLEGHPNVAIDWAAIHHIASGSMQPVLEMAKDSIAMLRKGQTPACPSRAAVNALADKLANRILVTTYTGRLNTYQFRGVSSRTVDSAMPERPGCTYKRKGVEVHPVPQACSFREYYRTRYSVTDLDGGLPMIRAQHSNIRTAAINYLLPPAAAARRRVGRRAEQEAGDGAAEQAGRPVKVRRRDGSTKPGTDAAGEGSGVVVTPKTAAVDWIDPELVIELCYVHPLPIRTLTALQLVPSIMFRLEGLLVAHEIREKLRPEWLTPDAMPPVDKVLEAITHRSCNDLVDFERYEFLGDSIFKYLSVKNIFEHHQHTQDEGGMTLIRDKSVSNGTLLRAAALTRYMKAPEGADLRYLHGVLERIRFKRYRLQYWTPPGLLENGSPIKRDIHPKIGADVLEALIGVFYEVSGPQLTACWLASLGLLPEHPAAPTKLSGRQDETRDFVPRLRAEVEKNKAYNMNVCLQVANGHVQEAYCPLDAFAASVAATSPSTPAVCEDEGAEDGEVLEDVEEQEQADQANSSQALSAYAQIAQEVARSGPAVAGPQRNLQLSIAQDSRINGVLMSVIGELENNGVVERLSEPTSCLPSAPVGPTNLQSAQFVAKLTSDLHKNGMQEVQRCLRAAEWMDTRGPSTVKEAKSSTTSVQGKSVSTILGHKFRDPRLAHTACVHASWMHREDEDYERLEFIGDAVLDLIVTSTIFYATGANSGNISPHQIHTLRSALVKNDTLAFMTCIAGLDRCLLHSSPSLQGRMSAFAAAVHDKMRMKEKHRVAAAMSNILYVATGSGMGYMGFMDYPKALGDILESCIGAVFVDTGMDICATYPIVLKLMDGFRGISPSTYPMHPFMIINKLTHQVGLQQPRFSVVRVQGAGEHERKGPSSRQQQQQQQPGRNNRLFKGRSWIANLWLTDVIYGATRQYVRVQCAEAVLSSIRNYPGWLDCVRVRCEDWIDIVAPSVCAGVGPGYAASSLSHKRKAADGTTDEGAPPSKSSKDAAGTRSASCTTRQGGHKLLSIPEVQLIHDDDVEAERAKKWQPPDADVPRGLARSHDSTDLDRTVSVKLQCGDDGVRLAIGAAEEMEREMMTAMIEGKDINDDATH